MDKTSAFGFPTPSFEYGSADGSAAAAEFTSSMAAAEVALISSIGVVSNNLSVEIGNRVSADNVLSNNISVVSAAAAALGDANVVSAQLVSVSAVLKGDINTVSNALSNETSNRTSADGLLSTIISGLSVERVSVSAVLKAAIDVVSNALSAEIVARGAAANVVSNAISVVSNAVSIETANRVIAINVLSNAISVVSQALSVVSLAAAEPIKAVNTDAQATISVSTMLTISGLSLPIVSGSNYFFKFIIPFTNNALTGIHIAVTGPTVTNFVAKVELPTGGTAQATVYTFAIIPTIGGIVSNVFHALSAVTLLAFVEGYVNPSASGSLHVTIGPTVNTASLVVQKGALGLAWKVS
jgi:hypothetical protein